MHPLNSNIGSLLWKGAGDLEKNRTELFVAVYYCISECCVTLITIASGKNMVFFSILSPHLRSALSISLYACLSSFQKSLHNGKLGQSLWSMAMC